MVLRCSLLGHDFGESEVEREREERGSEVVVTVQEYEECARCGERNVISENTEVTSLSAGTDADSLPDDPETEPPEPTLESGAADGDEAELVDADDHADDAVLIDPDETEPADADPAETAPEPGPAGAADAASGAEPADGNEGDLPTDENGEPVTDDGEILENDEPSSDRNRDRDHGEWPNSDDVGPPVGADSEPADWPDDPVDDEPTGDDADPVAVDDDAVVLEDDEPTGGVGAAGTGGDGSTAAGADAQSVTADPPAEDRAGSDPAPATDSGTGIERVDAAPAPAESGGVPDDDVPTEFYCPRCDFVAGGDRGSLRTGDICPECRKGYLSERERGR